MSHLSKTLAEKQERAAVRPALDLEREMMIDLQTIPEADGFSGWNRRVVVQQLIAKGWVRRG